MCGHRMRQKSNPGNLNGVPGASEGIKRLPAAPHPTQWKLVRGIPGVQRVDGHIAFQIYLDLIEGLS